MLLTRCVAAGKPLLLSGLQCALLQNAQLGPRGLLLRLLPPCDSQPPSSVQDVAPHPPRGLPASHTLHSRRNTLPLSCPGSAWQALGCREDGRWGNGPSSSSLRGESWPVASHNRPGATEGICLGDPRSHVNLRSPLARCLFSPSRQAQYQHRLCCEGGCGCCTELSSPSMGWETGQKEAGGTVRWPQ